MTTYSSVFQAAMQLSPGERSRLAEALLGTMDNSSDQELLAQFTPEYRAEIARRSAEVDAGTAQHTTWEEMIEQAKATAGHHD